MSSGLFKVLRWGNAITTGYDSFTGDTLVWTENGTIGISEVAIGDEVYAYDAETGEAILAKVTDISVSETDELLHLTIGGELIRTTASHPFYTTSGEWKAAGDLMVGDCVVTMTGEATVEATEVEKLSEAVTVYNLTVEGEHNYYVAENGVLVHNKCKKKGAKNTDGKTSSGVPVPKTTKASNGLDYKSNQKHTLGQMGNSPDAGIEPRNSLDLFGNSVSSSKAEGVRFTYDKESGILHRFFEDGNGIWHWSGSTG